MSVEHQKNEIKFNQKNIQTDQDNVQQNLNYPSVQEKTINYIARITSIIQNTTISTKHTYEVLRTQMEFARLFPRILTGELVVQTSEQGLPRVETHWKHNGPITPDPFHEIRVLIGIMPDY